MHALVKLCYTYFVRGSITLIVLLSIIIVGSIILVGGAYPIISYQTLNMDNQKTFEEEENITPTGKPNNKQLQITELKNCSDSLAVEFLLDTSGSMEDGGKIQKLKDALNFFVGQLKKNAVIGIRTFNDTTSLQLPFDFYKNNQANVSTIITSLVPGGGTSTRDAFVATQKDLVDILPKKDFKNYTFNVIFFSDGIPETADANTKNAGKCTPEPRNESGHRCFDTLQDPTNNAIPGGNISEQIKNLKNKDGRKIRIFSVLLFDRDNDLYFKSEEETIMEHVASSPQDFYKTTQSEDLQKIFKQIITQVCN